MLTDLQLAQLCQSQYDGADIFDHTFINEAGDCYSIKYYPDCTVVAHEGSHDLMNWFNNARFVMKQIPDFAGVDEGFDVGIPEATIQALPLVPKDRPVYFTGHSRGAPRAQLMAARFILQGFDVITVTFASPRPGDAELAKIINTKPCRSYRNYHAFLDQDFVCDVPAPYPFAYVHVVEPTLVDVAPEPNDSLGVLARHHLSLYIEGLQNGQSSTGL